jgi:flagellar biosynthesis anti-sigma factor FlgM
MSSIDSINIGNPGLDPTQALQGKDQTRSSGLRQSTGSGNDSVQLSSTAQEIDRVSAMVSQSRDQRIEQLRASVQAGTYNVSGADIASKMIGLNG